MIYLRVMRFDDALGRQFVALVNRLLPAGSRFSLDALPQLEYVTAGGSFAFPGTTHVHEVIAEARLDINPNAPGSNAADQVWKRRFRDELNRLVTDTRQHATIELVAANQQTIVGEFRLRQLDISDIAQMPDMMAASTLIHELEEQTQRGDHPWEAPDFDPPHRQAMEVESRISGGERQEDLELRHPPGVDETNVDRNQRWMWWIPFRTRDGALWVNQLEMLGRNILRAHLGRYPDVVTYRHAFAAEIANRRTDTVRTSRH